MHIEVELPDTGTAGGDQARVAEWFFEEGEQLEEGDVLLEVVCDLEMIEVRSPSSGTLIERIVEEDEIVRIGEPVALIDTDEDSDFFEEDEE